ncbi:MAG: DUF2341 domain-containing protein [Candidatus Dojkabacteria bacterium]
MYLFVNPQSVSADEWFSDSWAYRKAIDISGNASDLTDIQFQVTGVDTQALFNSGKVQSWCEDIRFTNRNGQLLDYWIEDDGTDCDADTSTDFWVKLDRAESEGTRIFMYYGNPLARAYQSGSRTFDFFSSFDEWYDEDWKFRIRLTIDHTKVEETVEDFPVYVDLSDLPASFFSNVQSDGSDIVVTRVEDAAKLSREVVAINTGGSTGELWFSAPKLYTQTDTSFYIYYGNASATETNNSGTWNSNYDLVFHMNEDPSVSTDGDCGGGTDEVCDSTVNNNDADSNGGMTTGDLVGGQLGSGIDFDGGDDYLSMNDESSSAFTYSAWYKTINETGTKMILQTSNGHLRLQNNNHLFSNFDSRNGTGSTHEAAILGNATQDIWHHIAMSVTSGHVVQVVHDGTSIYNTTPPTGSSTSNYANGKVGVRYRTAPSANFYDYFEGVLDEVRVVNTNLGSNWISTEYNNQSSPGTFYGISSQERNVPVFSSPDSWYNEAWAKRVKVTVNNSKVDEDVTGFPVYLDLSLLGTSFWNNVDAQGDDIVVTSGDGATKLARELVTIDTSGKTGELWFNSDLSSTVDTDVYIYYGNASATETNDTSTWNSNFQTVHHLEEDPGGVAPQMSDSTSNGYNGTANGGMTNADQVAGKIGNASDLDGNDFFATTYQPSGQTEVSFSAWVNLSTSGIVFINGFNSVTDAFYFYLRDSDNLLGWGVEGANLQDLTQTYAQSEWLYVVGTFQSGTTSGKKIYLNGQLVTSATQTATITAATDYDIGQRFSGNTLTGMMDETRVVNAVLSGNWISTEYSNQNSPSTFFTIGSSESNSAPQASWYNGDWQYRQRISIRNSQVDTDLTDFPVYVDLSNMGSDFFREVKSDGSDIVVTSSDGFTKLSRELVAIDTSGSTGELWFKAPNLYDASNTSFYIYFGNSSAAEINSTSTWKSDYKGIWHLEGVFTDSTTNANNGTDSGSNAATGRFGNARSFPDTADLVTLGTSGYSASNTYTVATWLKPTIDIDAHAWEGGSVLSAPSLEGTSDSLSYYVNGVTSISTGSLTSGQWYYVVAVYDKAGTTQELYVDGVSKGTNSLDITDTFGGNFYLGNRGLAGGGGTTRNYGGTIDEVRVTNTVVSGTWISTEYNNQSSPGNFYGVGGIESSSNWNSFGGPDVSGGTATLSSVGDTEGLVTSTQFLENSKLIVRATQSSTSLNTARLGFSNSGISSTFTNDDSASYLFDSSTGANFEISNSNDGTATDGAGTTVEDTVTHDLEVGWRNAAVDFRLDNGAEGTVSTNPPNENMNVRLEVDTTDESVSIEWVAVGNYDSNPPNSQVINSEEVGGGELVYLPMDESSGQNVNNLGSQADIIGLLGTNALSESSDPSRVDECAKGNCLDFDGTDDVVTVADDDRIDFDTTDDFTITTWVKIEAATSEKVIFSKRVHTGATPEEGYFARLRATGEVEFGIEQASNTTTEVGGVGTTIIDDDRWHQVAFVRDVTADMVRYYLDGVLEEELTDTTTATLANTEDLLLGKRSGTNPDYMNGQIDEFRIFRKALTAAEILGQFNESGSVLGTDTNNLRDGLVGWWKLDEESWNGTSNEVVDYSGLDHHGNRNGNATTTGGHFGNAGTFDGNGDYAGFADTVDHEPASTVTVSAWVYPNNVATWHQVVVKRYSEASNPWDSYMLASTGVGASNKWRFCVSNGTSGSSVCADDTEVITANTWVHLVGRYDGSDVKLFVDGVEKSSVSKTGNIGYSSIGLRIGISTPTQPTQCMNGKIDEVRLYNRALSLTEIETLYEYRAPSVAHWKFDETSGTTAYDSSINGYNGTLTNMAEADHIDGKVGGALDFDGIDGYVTAGDNLVGLTFPVTVSFWINPDATEGANIFSTDSWNVAANYAGIAIVLSATNQVNLMYGDGTGSGSADRRSGTTTATLSTGTWHHVTGIIRGATDMEVFINGVSSALTYSGTGGSMVQTSDPILISTTVLPLDGQLDDIRVYDYERTPAEIGSEYAQGARAAVPQNELVGHWKMDESSWNGTADEVIDSSGLGNHGTSSNGATTTVGKISRAGIFDGSNDSVTVADVNELDMGTNDFSITAWVKTDNAGADMRVIFGDGNMQGGGDNSYAVLLHDNKPAFELYDNTTYLSRTTTASSTTVNDGKWHHLAFVFDRSGSGSIYIDGVFDKATSISSIGSLDNTRGGAIGNQPTRAFYYAGQIDELRVIRRVLSDEEVYSLYDSFYDVTVSERKQAGEEVLYLPLNEKSGLTAEDISGNGYNGTLNNTEDSDHRFGKIDYSVDLDGSNEYISVSDNNDFSPSVTGAVTMSAWIRPDTIVAGNTYILTKGDTSNYEYAIWLGTGGEVGCTAWTLAGLNHLAVSGSTSTSANEWHHVACVIEHNSEMNIYLDGASEGTDSTPSSTMGNGTADVQIGKRGDDVGNEFDGRVDEVKIWDFALSTRQIAMEYNGGKPVSHWRMDRREGNMAYDYSENGNHTQLINMAPASDWLSGTSCRMNGCLDFDGINDRLWVADDDLFDASLNDRSYSAWVKMPSDISAGIGTIRAIVSKVAPSLQEPRFDVDVLKSSGFVVFEIESSTNGDLTNITGTTDLRDNQWHHIVAVRDRKNDELRLYVDGAQDASPVTDGDQDASNSGALYIGDWAPDLSNGRNFLGQLDEVKVFNYALTDADVLLDYNLGSAIRYE